jgi:hypothetical protein
MAKIDKINKELDLSREEVELLLEAFGALNNRLEEDRRATGRYMDYAHFTKEIQSADGQVTPEDKLFSDNIRFFEVNDKIKKFIDAKKIRANQLINKIVLTNKNFV